MERFKRRVSADENYQRLERAVNGLMVYRGSSPGRHSGSEDVAAGGNFKGPLGLNLLHTVDGPLVDFIFIHGLGGGSRKTWSKSPRQQHFWPKEWLSRDSEFEHVRIHSFGYKADWSEKRESVLETHDFARSLLGDIDCNPDIRRSQTKIVFIAHSMGGIVAKKAYVLAREDPVLRNLASRIHTMYFLATPHQGSDLTKTLTNILRVSYGQKPFVTELVRNSGSITSANKNFQYYADDLQLWSFYETVPCSLIFTSAMIVDKASAILGYTNERTHLLNADHRGVCKFDTPSDPNYRTLRNALVTTVESISSELTEATSEHSNSIIDHLMNVTGVSGPPTHDLAALQEARVPGSCEWFTLKPFYISWRTPSSDCPPVLWLTATAGSGKSVLCSQVLNDLYEHGNQCNYFFFSSKVSTLAGSLRSLAVQMARSNVKVSQRMWQVVQDALPCSQWDAKTVWLRLFVGCIFKELPSETMFWVFDALDECQEFPVLTKLISEMTQRIRVFLTSRGNPEVEQSIKSLGQLVEHYQIQPLDTFEDLRTFVSSRADRLPAANNESCAKLKEKLLTKAAGSFLWVALVVQELEQAYSEEAAEEVLNEVPQDMGKLYLRMLETITKNERAIRVAKSIFLWTVLPFKALTIDEMRCAIKFDTHETIYDLRKSISAICGQLVNVDQNNRVRSIHQTAQSFLLQQDAVPRLILNRQESHTKIAEICLRFLGSVALRGSRPHKFGTVSSALVQDDALTEYACLFFSDHLQKSFPENSAVCNLLCNFLSSNVLPWIEYLAKTGRLYHVTCAAKNLRAYLARRLRYTVPFSRERDTLERWIVDLLRLCTKFRESLMTSPSSIYTLILALCPRESIISKTYASRRRGFAVKGLNDQTWDDCSARLDYSSQVMAVALGNHYSAVAVSDGTIFLYDRDLISMKIKFKHGEWPKLILFSEDCQYLASSGLRMVRLWDPESQAQVWAFDPGRQTLAISFSADSLVLIVATQGNCTLAWNLKDGREIEKWTWTESIHESDGYPRPCQSPSKAFFSADSRTLAVCYRGLAIYLFDTETNSFMGCCSKDSAFQSPTECPIDTLAFNPNPEINILLASYGDGELAVYDFLTTKIRNRILNVFAQSIACSPDGRTFVIGSSRGTIQIFKFAGIESEKLLLIHRIDAREDRIQGIAFSDDSLRFADIRGSQCRIWEPSALIRNDPDEESHNELASQAVTHLPKSVGMLESPVDADVCTVCHDPSGNRAFCGKQDGRVVYFETQEATEQGLLRKHATNVAVTSIAYSDKRSCLITADESGRILVTSIKFGKDKCESVGLIGEIRSEEAITVTLLDSIGSRLLLQSRASARIWTMEMAEVGTAIPLFPEEEHKFITRHAQEADYFIVTDSESSLVYSWNDAQEVQSPVREQTSTLATDDTPAPAVDQKQTPHSRVPFDSSLPQQSVQFIADLRSVSTNSYITTSSRAKLEVWPTANLPTCSANPRPPPLPTSEQLVAKIRQVIAVTGSTLIFLDVDLWVCSLDLTSSVLSGNGARRHFFLLSEWQSSNGLFIIDYVPAKREFLVAYGHRILVVNRGLDLSEPWIKI